jgi:pyrroloquinoline quinone (PQQ) biosynthesis protein C
MAPPPKVLTPAVIEDYKAAMTCANPDDWEGHKRRVAAAQRLGVAAFRDNDRMAWEVVQTIEWFLQTRSQLRPTEPGDVHVLSTLYRIHEEHEPLLPLDRELSTEEFLQKMSDDCYALNALETPILKLLSSDKVKREDFRYVLHQFVPPAADFTKMLAVSAVRFPYEFALSVYENLYEEAGSGNRENAHFRQLVRDASQYGVEMNNRPEIIDWICPEIIANTNTTFRMIWHYDPSWSLGAMYVMERLLPPELSAMREGMRILKMERMEFFDTHITGDEQHAAEWLQIVTRHLNTYEKKQLAYSAAIRRGRWNKRGWEAIYPGLLQWKETGEGPRLPVRELTAATGIDPTVPCMQ